MSNFRSRALLDLAYELPCTGRITADCGNSMGEPAHANEAIWGKGKSLKAHDFAFAAMCRSCHAELDQGSTMSRESRQFIWLRGHVETMRLLWERGFLRVAARPLDDCLSPSNRQPPRSKKQIASAAFRPSRKRASRCTAAANQVKRNPKVLA